MAERVGMPNDTQHVSIIGRNGSGKTVAAVWHLSVRSFDKMPWIIFDYKGDELINSIERAEYIDLRKAPKKPGIYIVQPLPDQIDEVNEFMWQIWNNEKTGVYIDEGYMMTGSPAFRALLTQGRSKKIPLIVLSQRPVWMDRFVFSESTFFQVFHLNHRKDRQTVQEFISKPIDGRLPEYHSYWYDVNADRLNVFSPVPQGPRILDVINSRMQPKKRYL